MKEGLVGASRGTIIWHDDLYRNEEMTRAWLAMDWAMQNGLSHKVRLIDGITDRKYTLGPNGVVKGPLKIKWSKLHLWVADKWDELRFHIRKFFMREKNPYDVKGK